MPHCLYDPERGEWIRLFDGFTLGQARGNAKFAVELENSHNHCSFRLEKGAVRLVDLGSPLGTRVNEKTVLPGGELELRENDRMRINGRDFYLTRWKVLPEIQQGPERPFPEEQVAEKSPSNSVRRLSARLSYMPVDGVRGATAGAGPGFGERSLRALGAAVTTLHARSLQAWRLVLELKRFWEPALIATILAALFALKFGGGHAAPTRESEPVRREIAAVDAQLPRTALEPKKSALPVPQLESKASIAPHPLPDPRESEIKAEIARRLPVPQAVAPLKAASAGSPKAVSQVKLPPPSPVHAPVVAAPKQHPVFEVIPVGDGGPSEEARREPGPDSGHFRITAISVMGPDARQTTFDQNVSPGTILSAYDRMNREPAAGSAALATDSPDTARIFDLPQVERDGKAYLVDWCLTWEGSCGKPAADAFCREMGMTAAVSFAEAHGAGGPSRPTAIIGEPGVFCPGSSPGHVCDALSYVKCR